MAQKTYLPYPAGGSKKGQLEAALAESYGRKIEFFNFEDYVTKCVRCQKLTRVFSKQAREPSEDIGPVAPCPNCGNQAKFYVGRDSVTNDIGIFCDVCRKGYTRWICSGCGTDNAVVTSFGSFCARYCFIATCVYGSPSAPEVELLRHFRDDVLRRYLLGQIFIKFYYWTSPTIVRLLEKSYFVKKGIKIVFVDGLVWLLKSYRVD